MSARSTPMHVRLRGQAARDIVSGNDSFPNEDVDDAAGAVQLCPGFLDLFARDQAHIPQKTDQVVFVRLRHRTMEDHERPDGRGASIE